MALAISLPTEAVDQVAEPFRADRTSRRRVRECFTHDDGRFEVSVVDADLGFTGLVFDFAAEFGSAERVRITGPHQTSDEALAAATALLTS